MTKSGRRKAKQTRSLGEFFTLWNRGQAVMCGCVSKSMFIFILFGVCAVIVLILAFTIPRVPAFSFNINAPLTNATGEWNASIPVYFNRLPANFSFPGVAQLEADTTSNWVPLHFRYLRAQVYDLQTSRQVASGLWAGASMGAKSFVNIQIPLNFTYLASNDSDQTWKNWYASCRNTGNYANGQRPGLNFLLLLEMGLLGLVGVRRTSSSILNVNCPVELALNAG